VTTVGLLSPGAMGAAIGACIVAGGARVLWASAGRTRASEDRARHAGLDDVGDLQRLCAEVDVLLSVCPPHAALSTAREVAANAFDGVYVDANAIAPATALDVARVVEPAASFVDGGIVGPPPRSAGSTRLYLAGDEAPRVAELFSAPLETVVLDAGAPAASALKVAFAAWTKGTSALLLAVRAYAASQGVEDDLVAEWCRSLPDLPARTERTATEVAPKAWRWVGEMEEIAEAFEAAALPGDLHMGAAEVYRRLSGWKDHPGATIGDVIGDLLGDPPPEGPEP
jgi:3-hydroxyisobutyrate dehydrogenase-like beta-hydroxyacid dehydrogenase